MANNLPWFERVTLFEIHPDAASRNDIARLAMEWLAAYNVDDVDDVDDVDTPEEEVAS